jgi:thiosulfate/3-mercaptopyruvate sulfurtransferase
MKTTFLLTSAVVLWSGTLLAAPEKGYAHPEFLLEPAELARPEVAKQFVILDAGNEEQHKKAHIPGALWIDHAAWKAAFGDGQDAEGWSARIGELGIRPGSKVVVYDDLGFKNAGRIWWILRYWGVKDVRLLNGGWKAWTAGGYPTTGEPTPAPAPAEFKAKPRPARLATLQQMLRAVGGNPWQIVDARTEGEYCGVESHGNKKAGAIPGAKNLDWTNLVDPETGRFKSADELRRLFDRAGIDLTRPTATYCQSGGRASVMAFGLELMGARNVRNYYQSWAEWGNSEATPVMVPKKANEAKKE